MRYPPTKTATLLVTLAILLVALGGGFSYLGYNDSLQALTVTKTIPYSTTTHTLTFASTTSEWTVVTAKTETRISGPTVTVNPPLYAGCAVWVGYPLDALGAWHVSYSSDVPIDFWLDNEEHWWNLLDQYDKNPPSSCSYALPTGLVVSRLGSTSHEFTRNMSPNHWYHFGWVPSHGEGPVMIEYDIDLTYQSAFTMEMGYTAIFSTQQILFPTQSVRVSSYPAGLGPVFFAGFAILVAGIALTTVVAAVKTMTAPNVVSAKPCGQCGAKIPRGSKFCDKCGTAVPHDE